jgi:hypothetical protein
MNKELIRKKFQAIGADIIFEEVSRIGIHTPDRFTVDVQGKTYVIRMLEDLTFEVIDCRPEEQHLLLLWRDQTNWQNTLKFLCGHDERHFFVAALPETAPITNVFTAQEALKPHGVRKLEREGKVKAGKKQKRKKKVGKGRHIFRQGEWFFVPASIKVSEGEFIRKNEPISRGAGSSNHYLEECYRTGGDAVMVCGSQILTPKEHEALIKENPDARKWRWEHRTRDARVYARGRVTHSDHATIILPGWHEVLMNVESARKNVVFLD